MKQDIEISDDQMIAIAMLGAFLTTYGTVRGASSVAENVADAVGPIAEAAGSKGADALRQLVEFAKGGVLF